MFIITSALWTLVNFHLSETELKVYCRGASSRKNETVGPWKNSPNSCSISAINSRIKASILCNVVELEATTDAQQNKSGNIRWIMCCHSIGRVKFDDFFFC